MSSILLKIVSKSIYYSKNLYLKGEKALQQLFVLRILKVKVLLIKTMHAVDYFRRNNKGNVKLYISKKKYFGHKPVISD